MSPETIQLAERLLEMLGTGGDAAFWIALAWVMKPYFIGLLIAGVIMGSVVTSARLVRGLDTSYEFAKEVRKEAGVQYYRENIITEYERRMVIDLIREARIARNESSNSEE